MSELLTSRYREFQYQFINKTAVYNDLKNVAYDILKLKTDLAALSAIVATLPGVLTGIYPIIINEIPSGLIDGTNDIFTTANIYVSGSLMVYYNGEIVDPSNIVELTTTQYQLSFKPLAGTTVINTYFRPSSVSGIYPMVVNEVPVGAINGINDIFTTTNTYLTGSLMVYYSGQIVDPSDITELTTTSYQLSFKPLTGQTIINSYLRT